jgi:hypothetical protein
LLTWRNFGGGRVGVAIMMASTTVEAEVLDMPENLLDE